MIAELAGVGLVVGIGAAHARARHAEATARARTVRAARARAVTRARQAAQRGDWPALARTGWLPTLATAADPGNPGRALTLCADPHGLTGRPGGRVLLAVNGTPEADGTHTVHALSVPSHLTDPVAAAAWTYDDPDHPVRCTPATYAALTRRT